MANNYCPLSEIAAAIVEMLTATGEFRKTLYAQATNAEQLWQMQELTAAMPAAVVMIGRVDYEEDAFQRRLSPLICIAVPFKRGLENEADGAWSLAEAASRLFLPQDTAEGTYKPEAAGIEFEVVAVEPVASPPQLSAICITLSGVEPLSRIEN